MHDGACQSLLGVATPRESQIPHFTGDDGGSPVRERSNLRTPAAKLTLVCLLGDGGETWSSHLPPGHSELGSTTERMGVPWDSPRHAHLGSELGCLGCASWHIITTIKIIISIRHLHDT